MRNSSRSGLAFYLALLAAFALCAPALAGTSMPPIRAAIHKPVAQVFGTLKRYFSSAALSDFTLISADAATHTLTAQRTGVDTNTWNSWTICTVGPMDMLDTLEASAVTVKVELRAAEKNLTWATVTPVFSATYGMGAANRHTITCSSRGKLEEQVLQIANGGTPPP